VYLFLLLVPCMIGMLYFFSFFTLPTPLCLEVSEYCRNEEMKQGKEIKKRGGRFVCTVADPGCIVTYGRREVAVEVISFDILAFFLHFFGGVFSFFSFLISLFALFFL